MKLIGSSIQDAIDWTQDRLVTTRPLAERTLFSLINSHIVQETEEGFVILSEAEEPEEHHNRAKANFHKAFKKTRIKFHAKRKQIHQENMKNIQKRKMKHLDNVNTGDDDTDEDAK
jgi:hypothetical protein